MAFPYTKYRADWIDDDPTKPADAAAFDHIEAGIFDMSEVVIPETLVDAKGDLIVGTAADTVARKAAGADDLVLITASGQADGLKWEKIGRENLDTTTRKAAPLGTTSSPLSSNAWPDAATNHVDLLIPVPDDYVSGDITFKVVRRASVSSGTAVMRKNSFRIRDGSAITTIDSEVNINFTPGNTNSAVLTATIAAANFTAGDVLRLNLRRDGSDGSDNLAGGVQFDGAWIEYLGYV
jgi:hypothetical protein